MIINGLKLGVISTIVAVTNYKYSEEEIQNMLNSLDKEKILEILEKAYNAFQEVIKVIMVSIFIMCQIMIHNSSYANKDDMFDLFINNNLHKKQETITLDRFVNKKYSQLDNNLEVVDKVRSDTIISKLSKGHYALKYNNLNFAISLFKDVLLKEKDNMYALYGIAVAYQKQGNNKLADKYYNILINKYPENQDAINNYISLILESYNFYNINKDLMRIINAHSGNPYLHAKLSQIYFDYRDIDKSIYHIKKAISMDPKNLYYRYVMNFIEEYINEYELS